MTNVVNFSGVENNVGNSERKTVSPGVDIFTIAEAEVKKNINDKAYVAFKFENAAGKYFKSAFYITTDKAKGRVKEVITNSGIQIDASGDLDLTKLIGKKIGLIVEGTKENADIDGNMVVVTRSDIKKPYNFSFKVQDLEKFKDAKITIEDLTASAEKMLETSVEDPNDDLPF